VGACLKIVLVEFLETDLARINPSELLLTRDVARDPQLQKIFSPYHVTEREADWFNEIEGAQLLLEHFHVSKISDIGPFSPVCFFFFGICGFSLFIG